MLVRSQQSRPTIPARECDGGEGSCTPGEEDLEPQARHVPPPSIFKPDSTGQWSLRLRSLGLLFFKQAKAEHHRQRLPIYADLTLMVEALFCKQDVRVRFLQSAPFTCHNGSRYSG